MAKKEMNKSCGFRTSIGGQALIEGILMRGVDRQAIVCRGADGELITKVEELHLIKEKHPILGWPLIRGVVNFLDSMLKGVKAITYSAELLPEEEQEEPSKLDKWIEKKFSWEKAQKFIIGIAVVLGIGLALALFIFLPTLIVGFIPAVRDQYMARNLLEGACKLVIFLIYLWACTKAKDVQRMFAYHGAEHKTIFCYEKGLPLTVDNVRIQSRFHPRCGTSFLFVVIIISILVGSVIQISNTALRMVVRLLLLPIVVGISYEINRWVGRHDNVLSSILSWPGKQLQHLTTNEPDDSMMEVGIEALKLVIPEEKGADAW
jgi:uncharacterized protein YqhQ